VHPQRREFEADLAGYDRAGILLGYVRHVVPIPTEAPKVIFLTSNHSSAVAEPLASEMERLQCVELDRGWIE